jgi:hypothetical protein
MPENLVMSENCCTFARFFVEETQVSEKKVTLGFLTYKPVLVREH